MKLRLMTTVSLSVLLSACSMMPEYQQPANPMDAKVADAEQQQTQAAINIGWRDFYQDEQLQNLIASALTHNRDLQATALRVEQLRAQYQIQRAEQFPAVDGDAGYSRQRFQSSQVQGGSAGGNVSGIFEEYSVGVGVPSWEIDLFGRLESMEEAALQSYFASDAGRKSTQLTLVSEVADAYFSWQASEAQSRYAGDTLETLRSNLSLVEKRFEAGLASELDVRQAERLVHEARIQQTRFRQQANQNFTLLELLVGQPLDRATLDTRWSSDTTLHALPDELTSEALLQRPDVMQAEYEIKAANADIGAARAAFYPRLSLTTSLGLSGNNPADLTDLSNRTWQIAPQFTLPLIDWGVNDANLDVAELEKEITIQRYQEVIQTAFKEVYDELQARQTLDDELAAQQDLTKSSERSVSLAEKRFDAGVDSFLDVLDARRSLLEVELAQIDTRLAQLRNQVTLYKALGGGLLENSHSVNVRKSR